MVPLADDLKLYVQDLLQVVGERRAVVVGHSLGGDVALAAAIEAPDRIVAVGAYEPPLPRMAWWPRRSQASLEGVDPGRYAEQFFRCMVGDSAWDHLSDRARGDRLAEGPALVAELRSIRGERPPFDVAALTVPTATTSSTSPLTGPVAGSATRTACLKARRLPSPVSGSVRDAWCSRRRSSAVPAAVTSSSARCSASSAPT